MKKLALLLLPLFASCSSSHHMRDMRVGTRSGQPGPDVSKVIIYRTKTPGAPFPIYGGENLVGYSESGSYFEILCEPGGHRFSSSSTWPSDAVVTADLAPGKTYYIESYVVGGGGCSVASPQLRPLTHENGQWAKIETKINRLQSRELGPENATVPARKPGEKLKRIEEGNMEMRIDAERLSREDGR